MHELLSSQAIAGSISFSEGTDVLLAHGTAILLGSLYYVQEMPEVY